MNITTHTRSLLAGALTGVLDLSEESAIQYAEVDQSGPDDRIFYIRTGEEVPTDLSGEAGPRTTTYSVECYAREPGTVDAFADAVRTMHDHHGTANGIKVWAVEVSDRNDATYRGVKGEAEEIHLASLDLTLIWEPAPEA